MFGLRLSKKTEEFFARQTQADDAAAARISEQLRKANLRSFSLFDPTVKQAYDNLLAETGSPALAEIGAIGRAQHCILERAFSVFDDWE